MQVRVCTVGPILGIIGAVFFVVGVVVFALPPMSDVKTIVGGIFLGFAFLCLMVISIIRGWCWSHSHVTVDNRGAGTRVPVAITGINPFLPLIIPGPMRVEYHGLNSI
jgi:hypothetical protein